MNEMIITVGMVLLMFVIMVIIFSNTEKLVKALRNTPSPQPQTPPQSQTQSQAPSQPPPPPQPQVVNHFVPEPQPVAVVKKKVKVEEPSGEEYAAIAAAIYVYNNELHDEEYAVLTIERATRTLTPWSAKYHSMNTYFMRRNR